MKCGRCGGSVIDTWDYDPLGHRQIPKCISCGREAREGGEMAEMTEEQKAAKLEYQKKYRAEHPLTEEQKARRAERSKERYHARKGHRAAKKAWATRRVAHAGGNARPRQPKEVVKAPQVDKPSFFLSAEGMFAPAQELRIELVYQLAGVKIVKE